jgi:hypothetical protein
MNCDNPIRAYMTFTFCGSKRLHPNYLSVLGKDTFTSLFEAKLMINFKVTFFIINVLLNLYIMYYKVDIVLRKQ